MNRSLSRTEPVAPIRHMDGMDVGSSPIEWAVCEESTLTRFERQTMPFLGRLHAAATQMASAHADPDELVQQTYLQAFEAFELLPEGAGLKVWLFRILARTALDAAGQGNRPGDFVLQPTAQSSQGVFAERVPIPGEHAARVTQALDLLRDEDVSAALQCLTDEVRIVVYLADAEDFTPADIAEILGIFPGSVRSRLRHGRNLLLEILTAAAQRQGLLDWRHDRVHTN
ncbi:sigma factor-like helix-turn-helix DNA-binding protein [Actinacidiphila glaucinigra]|uniref:RNA polymerase sigma-70 factor, ECF subfamily n=1 Tax=Actinacidiphila glaucinigra TaxID=235986 RepID=A0A239NCL1_9ACTN|nr:sigma factor-like helix-turn-helix DNA-binding protein [Actinacidiphila glaucinigra]SNT52615.1 RNA polymerase sigma-70 factor, ECF subfamily [Actinacidiphila glaucinigra]